MFITKGELYAIRDALQSVLEEEDIDLEAIRTAIEMVEALIYNVPDDYDIEEFL